MKPTEEELGIEQTAEEKEIASRPLVEAPEEDVRQDEDEAEAPQQLEAPKDKTEARKGRDHGPDGKFLAKDAKTEPEAAVKPPPGFVDNRALQEERQNRRILEERLNILLESVNRRDAAAQPKPEAPVIPDKNVDPLGYIHYMDERLDKIEGESTAQRQQRDAAAAEQNEMNQVLAVAVPEFQAAVSADPELEPMRAGLMESYAKEICYLNSIPQDGRATPAQRAFVQAELTKVENSHIKFAVQSRRPIGEYIKGLAMTRGITAQLVQMAQQAAPVAAQPGQKPIAERQAAQQRHQSLGDLPGNAAPDRISAKDLLKMSKEDFAAFAKKMGDKGLDALMGGV